MPRKGARTEWQLDQDDWEERERFARFDIERPALHTQQSAQGVHPTIMPHR